MVHIRRKSITTERRVKLETLKHTTPRDIPTTNPSRQESDDAIRVCNDMGTISLLDAWYAYRMLLIPFVFATSLLIAWATAPRVAAQPSSSTSSQS
jgi:hypothetical protein